MAWSVKASLNAVLGKARNGVASLSMGELSDAAGGRVRLIVEMEAAFVGTVDIATDMSVEDVRVEVRLTNGVEDEPGGKGGGEG